MSVVSAVERDLEGLPAEFRDGGLAAGLLALAAGVENERVSLAQKTMAQKEIREGLDRLRELAPPAQREDAVDELRKRRDRRRSKAAGSKRS